MAAVWAESGEFEKAVDFQIRAVAKLDEDIKEFPDFRKWKAGFECRLKGYRKGHVWHLSKDADQFYINENEDEKECEVQVISMIHQGRQDIEAGRTISHEELLREIEQW